MQIVKSAYVNGIEYTVESNDNPNAVQIIAERKPNGIPAALLKSNVDGLLEFVIGKVSLTGGINHEDTIHYVKADDGSYDVTLIKSYDKKGSNATFWTALAGISGAVSGGDGVQAQMTAMAAQRAEAAKNKDAFSEVGITFSDGTKVILKDVEADELTNLTRGSKKASAFALKARYSF